MDKFSTQTLSSVHHLMHWRSKPLILAPVSDSNVIVETWCRCQLQLNYEAFIHSFVSVLFDELVQI